MNITTKLNDPIADFKLVDAYFRWALLSLVEVVGERGLDQILKKVGMERYIQVYASDKLEVVSNLEFVDFSRVMMGAMNVFGQASQNNIFYSGRVSARHAMRKNGELFNPPEELRARRSDLEQQVRASLETILKGYYDIARRTGQQYRARIEENDQYFYYHLESCAVCAGVSANEPVCLFFSGSLMESLKWFTGRQFSVVEVACRAMDDPACVWQISKKPMD
jgi:hypothetical protein